MSNIKDNTEEWEKEFYNKFYKGVAVINYQPEHEDYQTLSLIEIEDFIRQEKEKSYEQGKRETRNDWFDMCETELKAVRHSAYSEMEEAAETDFQRLIIKNLKAKLIQK